MKNNRIDKIIEFFQRNQSGGSSDVFSYLTSENIETSLVTIKRDMAKLSASNILVKHEKGPETSYSLTSLGRLTAYVDAHNYCSVEPDKRYGQNNFNFSIFENVNFELFSEKEVKSLAEATKNFLLKAKGMSEILQKKEIERFIIELSWKSSKIEGNTYSLLETEKLIKDGIKATGHDKEEATMILNHKVAFNFTYSDKEVFKKIDRANVEKIHSLLINGFNIKGDYRHGMVGVTGSKYRPLENEHQIKEAMENLFIAVNKVKNVYLKALLALVGISYIQPFEDGNKRTSRMVANAILMAYSLSPLSYRSVDEESYKEAILVFYELNSLIPFKKIFIDQYVFATENYFID